MILSIFWRSAALKGGFNNIQYRFTGKQRQQNVLIEQGRIAYVVAVSVTISTVFSTLFCSIIEISQLYVYYMIYITKGNQIFSDIFQDSYCSKMSSFLEDGDEIRQIMNDTSSPGDDVMEDVIHDVSAVTYFLPFTTRIAIATVSAVLFMLVIHSMFALRFATKLPTPFKVLSWELLVLDALLIAATTAEPWLLREENNYFRDAGGLGLILVNTIAALMTGERLVALHFPLKYISCGKKKIVTFGVTMGILVIEVVIYFVFRFVICMKTMRFGPCTLNKTLLVLVTQLLLCTGATVSFVQVVYTMIANKFKHRRRITRMALPQTYASDVMDTRVSATLFLLYPSMLTSALFTVLSPHWHIFRNESEIALCGIVSRLFMVFIHCLIFSVWFEESRLFVLTLLAPLNSAVAERADRMRIVVYNIVVSRALAGRSRSSHHSELSRTSRTSGQTSGKCSQTHPSCHSFTATIASGRRPNNERHVSRLQGNMDTLEHI